MKIIYILSAIMIELRKIINDELMNCQKTSQKNLKIFVFININIYIYIFYAIRRRNDINSIQIKVKKKKE